MKQNNKKAFSIIEVMIAIFVFAFGLTSVFAMLSWSIRMSDYSRNLIIASHLADEQLELFKNIRDSNYKKWQLWDIENPSEWHGTATFNEPSLVAKYYKLRYNDTNISWSFPIKAEELASFQAPDKNVQPTPSELSYMENYRLCITPYWRYTYDCLTAANEETSYYRYLQIEAPEYVSAEAALEVTSVVIWKGKKFHSTEISTIVTDWKRY